MCILFLFLLHHDTSIIKIKRLFTFLIRNEIFNEDYYSNACRLTMSSTFKFKKNAPVYNIDITEFHLSLNSNKINGIGNSILRATTNSVRPVGP